MADRSANEHMAAFAEAYGRSYANRRLRSAISATSTAARATVEAPSTAAAAAAAIASPESTGFTVWSTIMAILQSVMLPAFQIISFVSLVFAALPVLWYAPSVVRFFRRRGDQARLFFFRLGEQARDWYDDWTLNHEPFSLRETLTRLHNNLWYNERVDQWRRNYQALWHARDDFLNNLPKYTILALLVVLACNSLFHTTNPVKFMTWHELADAGFPVPAWTLHRDKRDGSNSHYKRDIWPVFESIPTTTTLPRAHVAAADDLLDDHHHAETIDMLPMTETHSMPELPTAPMATDFWAPPDGSSGEKTDVGDEMVWCRVCQNFHCCELPY